MRFDAISGKANTNFKILTVGVADHILTVTGKLYIRRKAPLPPITNRGVERTKTNTIIVECPKFNYFGYHFFNQ